MEVMLGFFRNSRPAWATRNPVSEEDLVIKGYNVPR